MKNWKWLILLVLAGCATLHDTDNAYWLKSNASNPSNASSSYLGMSDATSLLYYDNYVRGLDGAGRDRELEHVRMLYVRNKSDFHRLQYALALSSPGANANDRSAAQQLIAPLLVDKRDADLAALASMLNAQLNALSDMQSNMGLTLQQCQKRADELQKKLDAVKDIERSLMHRDKGKL